MAGNQGCVCHSSSWLGRVGSGRVGRFYCWVPVERSRLHIMSEKGFPYGCIIRTGSRTGNMAVRDNFSPEVTWGTAAKKNPMVPKSIFPIDRGVGVREMQEQNIGSESAEAETSRRRTSSLSLFFFKLQTSHFQVSNAEMLKHEQPF